MDGTGRYAPRGEQYSSYTDSPRAKIFIRKEGFKLMGASPPAAICLGSSFSIICQIGFFARLPDWFFRQIARLEVDGGSRQISQIGWIDRLARLDLLPD